MLPSRCHEHDRKWIISQISKLPRGNIATATIGYSKAYSEAHDAEPISHKKDNAARRAANTRLREYVEAIAKTK